MSLGAAGVLRLSPRLARAARVDWTRRESGMQGLDALAASAGVATPLAVTDLAMLTAGLAARGELRFGDTFDNRAVHEPGSRPTRRSTSCCARCQSSSARASRKA